MIYVICKTASKLAFTVCKCRGNDRSNAPELIFYAYIFKLFKLRVRVSGELVNCLIYVSS